MFSLAVDAVGKIPPYFWIEGYIGDSEADPPTEDESFFGVGDVTWPSIQVDNQQFAELIGEDVETDEGGFTITEDARSSQYIPGSYMTYVLTIGKLTPI